MTHKFPSYTSQNRCFSTSLTFYASQNNCFSDSPTLIVHLVKTPNPFLPFPSLHHTQKVNSNHLLFVTHIQSTFPSPYFSFLLLEAYSYSTSCKDTKSIPPFSLLTPPLKTRNTYYLLHLVYFFFSLLVFLLLKGLVFRDLVYHSLDFSSF